VARISCSRRVNSCSSGTNNSRTSPNAVRTAKASAWQCLERRRDTGRRAGIRTRRRRPGQTARSAGKKPRCRSGQRKDGRCCVASAFSTDGKSRAPDNSPKVRKVRLAGCCCCAASAFSRLRFRLIHAGGIACRRGGRAGLPPGGEERRCRAV